MLILIAIATLFPMSLYAQNQSDSVTVDTAPEEQAASEADSSSLANDETDMTFGDAEAQPELESEGFSAFSFWDLVRMILVLGFVIGSIYVVFYFLKRSSTQRLAGGAGLLRIVDEHALAGGKSLHLIEVGRQVFLVGAADDSVGLISEITDDETLDTIRLAVSVQASEQPRAFSDLLSSLWPSKGAAAEGSRQGAVRRDATRDNTGDNTSGLESVSAGGGAGVGTFDFIGRQRDRLRRLR
jgi:flagellar biogenesis protein FliO